MALDNCPGCSSRLVAGACPTCGFAVAPEIVLGEKEKQRTQEILAAQPKTGAATAPMALMNCPTCSNRISESAVNCPKCGFVLTPEILLAQREMRAQSERIANSPQGAVVAFGFVLLAGLFWSCVSSGSTSSSAPTSDSYTSAQKVTYLDHGNFNATATAQLQERLTRLSRKYGLSEDDVAGKLLKVQELLADSNVRMTVQQIADSVESAAPTTTSVSFDELLATYVTLREKDTDAETIAQMRALWADLGLR
jgi:transcription initiation factor TFIIIB Brf1 subunit/transcription initiation factor TFIIB